MIDLIFKFLYKYRKLNKEHLMFKNIIDTLSAGIGPGQIPVIPDNGSMPDQIGLINAIMGINPLQEVVYNVDTATASKTLSGTEISGAAQVYLNFTGTFGAGGTLTLPLVTALVAALPATVSANPIGISWQLRVINTGTTQTLTVATNTGWTTGGTLTVANNTFRDFVVVISGTVASPTATIQSVGVGTQS